MYNSNQTEYPINIFKCIGGWITRTLSLNDLQKEEIWIIQLKSLQLG
jgi:hypothetical protein